MSAYPVLALECVHCGRCVILDDEVHRDEDIIKALKANNFYVGAETGRCEPDDDCVLGAECNKCHEDYVERRKEDK